MATLVIGDVHGQFDQLQKLLTKAKDAQIVFVGDLVGRGPKSLEVLRSVADYGDRIKVVLGNHDLHLLWSFYNNIEPGHDLDQVVDAKDAKQLCDWLRNQQLAIDFDELNTLVVHAGVWPSWDTQTVIGIANELETQLRNENYLDVLNKLYGSDYLSWDDDLDKSARWQAAINILTRMRVINSNHKIEIGYKGMPGEAPPNGAVAWFDVAKRKLAHKLIVCGHWSVYGLLVRSDVVMLDTGCVFGGLLTGMWLETRKFEFVN